MGRSKLYLFPANFEKQEHKSSSSVLYETNSSSLNGKKPHAFCTQHHYKLYSVNRSYRKNTQYHFPSVHNVINEY